jgi:hypothetical protein
MRHTYTATGKEAVYRYYQTDPGESWLRAFVWKPGQEALRCYVNLCKQNPCQVGD